MNRHPSQEKIHIINYSTFKTPFGLCLVASTSHGICNVLFADTIKEAKQDLQSRWPQVKLVQKTESTHVAVQQNFLGNFSRSNIKLDVHGTVFQKKVWETLMTIEAGDVSTYGEIAEKLGDKKLSRAVGTAIGANPIGYIIPCHRVVKSTGEISGYRWGVERKRAMLSFEGIQK
jgi:AraC family transcriptional regulator of adaptative response/methylated-DNA-[protein]-cysteine methyltransferase